MNPRKHRHTAFYTYMAPFLKTGNEQIIAEAKKQYRREYKAHWRKAKRKQTKEITISWNREEYRTLSDEARRHRESITSFIKKSSVAYMNKRFVVPNEEQVDKTIQLLALTYNTISELRDESNIPAEAGRKVLSVIQELERDIRIALLSPKTIEQTISEYIREKPRARHHLIEHIQNLQV